MNIISQNFKDVLKNKITNMYGLIFYDYEKNS